MERPVQRRDHFARPRARHQLARLAVDRHHPIRERDRLDLGGQRARLDAHRGRGCRQGAVHKIGDLEIVVSRSSDSSGYIGVRHA